MKPHCLHPSRAVAEFNTPRSGPTNMSRRRVNMAIGSLLLGAQLGCAAQRRAPDEYRLVRVDRRDVAIRFRRGGRGPIVVCESGLGDGLEIWDGVFAAINPAIPLFAYSRPGYGDSDAVEDRSDVRSSGDAAPFLRAVLRAARIRAPYVLVGHSLGGLYIAKYAQLFPSDVTGLVFVDGRPPQFRASCVAHAVGFCSSAQRQQTPTNWPAHIVSESNGIEASELEAPPIGDLSQIPATVITSTNAWPGEDAAPAFALWLASQEAFANGFADHRLVRAENSGHYVHREHPAFVAREIESAIVHSRRDRLPPRWERALRPAL